MRGNGDEEAETAIDDDGGGHIINNNHNRHNNVVAAVPGVGGNGGPRARARRLRVDAVRVWRGAVVLALGHQLGRREDRLRRDPLGKDEVAHRTLPGYGPQPTRSERIQGWMTFSAIVVVIL